jgi:hypothetical protein
MTIDDRIGGVGWCVDCFVSAERLRQSSIKPSEVKQDTGTRQFQDTLFLLEG